MAEGKKSFVAYSDWHGMFKALPDEVAGKLIKHIFSYVNDENPTSEDFVINALFEQVKSTLKRDLKKWEQTLEGRSKAGKASAEARRLAKEKEQILTNSTNVDFVQQSSTNSTDNVNVNVNVNDKINNIEQRKLKFASTLKPYVEVYGKDLLRDFYNYWTEPNKSNTKFKQELEKTWSLERRLETWSKNDTNFNKNKNEKSNITNTEQFKDLTKAIRSSGDRI
jgi:hypothetical protein